MAPPKGRTRIAVTYSGPLFDGRAKVAVREFLAAAVGKVTEMTDAELHRAMGSRFRHPTGYFESRVQMVPVSELQRVISDPVIYGPWLEGTSRRNQSTRFKGYKIWRRTRQKMRKLATPTAQAMLDAFIGRMN